DENVDHNKSAKERRICIAYLFPVKRKKSEEDKCAKRRRLEGVAYDENVEHKKSAKERRICIAYLFPVKRKKSEEDECAKRRRLEGVASRSSDDDYDYCEIIHAFSLHRKRSINTDLVSFLIDLLQILRRDSMGKIEECVYTFTEDEVNMAKEFFVEQECFQHEASKPLRQDSYLIRYATEDTDSYALPGIDYEIHLPLLKPSGDGEVPSKNMNLSNDLHLTEKADHQHQVEHFLDICQYCGRRHTLEFDQPNEEVYPVKTGQPNEGQTSERLNEVGKADHLDEAKQIKLVTASAGSRQLEQVYTETSMTVQEKKGEIQVQVLPNDFVCQSDVASVSKENLQEALNSADCIRDETFKNLEYKMVTHYPFQKNMFFEKCDDPYFHTQKKNFAPPEDTEKDFYRELEMPQPQIDTSLLKFIALPAFDPVLAIIDQIANGTPPTPHISMRYELLRFCTLRSYPKENKPYLIKLAEAGFYYASDGDGVVCYCCGVRRYNWVAEDRPMEIHERINPNCKFLRKNEEVNVPVQYFGPYNRALMAIIDIPEPRERSEQSEDVNNDWAPERIRSPAPSQQNRQVETGANSLGINTATPKHTQYATKTARESSFSEWPDTASHTPQELAEAGFFYAGFGDCVRCFYCGIGLRHWTKDDNPWIEHARWSRNCVFVKQKKGEEFVNLVQLAVQYSQDVS
ncbi:uncharacterized protein LOC123552198, partial [Mercenaria mercenaria]|uniref:uncharacterized protein LOC123552198 n=1 Tax=Mercenaria mercenaria TaxID=6596 RepID=UPI00234EFAE7